MIKQHFILKTLPLYSTSKQMYTPRNDIRCPILYRKRTILCQSGNGDDSVFDVHAQYTSKNCADENDASQTDVLFIYVFTDQ